MQNSDWSVVCHLNYGGKGVVSTVRRRSGRTQVTRLAVNPSSGFALERRPVFLGVRDTGSAVLLDPPTQRIHESTGVPEDVNPTYAYPDAERAQLWFSNDGDEESGNDLLHCGDQGSSITIIDRVNAQVLKTLCIGRGHHVCVFCAPTPTHPNIPQLAFVSNLLDGTLSIIGNDPSNTAEYLQVLSTINLLERDKEKDSTTNVPNNAFPHGMVYSPVTGKIYNLNNGYGTVVVIDPVSGVIEQRIPLLGCSNLLLSPDGRYVLGKGADRKSDPEHVLGKVAVIDATQGRVVSECTLRDFYPSTFRFGPDGKKLYVTSAATGKGKQKENLDIRSVRVFDATALPALQELPAILAGAADCGRRPLAFTAGDVASSTVFIPNPTDGTLTLVSGATDQVLDSVSIGEPGSEEVLFSFWNGDTTGS